MLGSRGQEQLRIAGHEVSGSHVDPRAIKTLTPLSEVTAAIARAVTAKVILLKYLVDTNSNQKPLCACSASGRNTCKHLILRVPRCSVKRVLPGPLE